MKELVHYKAKAVALRKKGLSYNDILKQVPVAKSSLSLWLKDLPLTKSEKKVLKKRLDTNISIGRIRAGAVLHQNKLNRDQLLLTEAKNFFEKHKNNTLFHTGVALYWAEGAKRNEQFLFMNSDETMIKTMLIWLETFTEYTRFELGYRLFIHHPFARDDWEHWWQNYLGVSNKQFKKTILKPTSLGVKKRPNYKGCLRVEVPRSTHLLTKIKFWMNMVVEYHSKQ
ncbi:MAG: hypothetical protein RLZZ76_740 [Candidatus Parcubacteria bacterium]|jgi:hypothetical protein